MKSSWRRLAVVVAGTLLGYVVFNAAAVLFADLGYWGWILLGALVVAVMLLVQMLTCRQGAPEAALGIGLGLPTARSMLTAVVIGALLLACYPVISNLTGAQFTLPLAILPYAALFAKNGVAEEVLFRGYLFGRLRDDYSFWRAVVIMMIVFAVSHIYLVFTLGPAIGVSSILLAVGTSPALARLYELGGRTAWAPAIVHTAIDTLIVALTPEAMARPETLTGILSWYVAALTIPYLAFLVRRPPGREYEGGAAPGQAKSAEASGPGPAPSAGQVRGG